MPYKKVFQAAKHPEKDFDAYKEDRMDMNGSPDIFIQAEAPAEGEKNRQPVGKDAFHLFLLICLPRAQVLDVTGHAPSTVKR